MALFGREQITGGDHGRPRKLDLWAAELRPALLTVIQAAQVLNLGCSTVYELIADGRLQVVHSGLSTRVPTDAIARLIANLRAGESVAAGSLP